jgi:hypothetical protein
VQQPGKYSTDKYHVTILVAVWGIVHAFLFFHYGIRSLYDAKVYIQCADALIQDGALEDSHFIFYSVPIHLIAFFRWIFPGQLVPYLVFQCVISLFATIALYRASAKIFNPKAGLISGIIFLIWWDNIHWNTTAMTESLACSIICFLILRLASFKDSIADYFWVIILSVIAFFTRPTGILIIVSTIAFLVHYHWHAIRYRFVWRFVIVPCMFVIAYISADFMFTRWDFSAQYRKGNIVTYMDDIQGGALYSESMRLEIDSLVISSDKPAVLRMLFFALDNPVYFLKSAGLKVWYLVSAVRPYYSTAHNLYALIWVMLIYILYYFGWRNKVVGFRRATDSTKIFTAVMIVLNCCLIAISSVDWDNRFYIPMEPGLVLLAGGGAAYSIRALKLKFGSSR